MSTVIGEAEEVSSSLLGQVKVFRMSQEQWANIKRLFKQRDEAFRFCFFKMIMLESEVTQVRDVARTGVSTV